MSFTDWPLARLLVIAASVAVRPKMLCSATCDGIGHSGSRTNTMAAGVAKP